MRITKKHFTWFVLLPLFLCACAALFYINYFTTVKIIVDGKEINARLKNTSVGDFIKSYGVAFSSADIITPSLDKRVPWHGAIRIVRITENIETIKEVLPFIIRWSKLYSKNLRPAELQRGTQKVKIKLVKTTYHDGKAVTKEILRERTTSRTFYRLALLYKDGSWECLYDLSKSKKFKMIATAYYPGDPLAWGDGTETFLGEKMQRGIVAVDPRVIPLKTRVFVSNYGYGWAGDTGNMIKGKRIDLGVNNKEEEKDYMHVPVVVYILEKADTW
jgi:3D (Asp-Asp-Asp) domain-containing protein